MNKSEKVFRSIQKSQLIALLTPKSPNECVKAYELLKPSGIVLEVALRSERAVAGIKSILKKYPDAAVLAGTVMTREQAEKAIRAGAAGIVSADYIPEVVEACVQSDVMYVPGGLSDAGKQLVQKATKYGCSLEELREKYPYQWIYKLFPAFSGKLSNMDLPLSWKGPFKDLAVVYTGGITLNNLKEAVQKAPEGIFCASALTKNIDKPALMKEEIQRWRDALKPSVSKPQKIKKVQEPLERLVPRIVTVGELMMRLSPPVGIRLQNVQNFDVNFGGAEANVAVSLARFGMNAAFVTALPQNDLGDHAFSVLRMHGVDTRFILRRGKRIGIYYLEHGSGPRPSKVVYDRAHSAFSELGSSDLDWTQILEGAQWFHWTGITPALSDSVAASLRKGLALAKKKGITVSVDLNYRKKLWTGEKAREVMTELMPFVDILIGNEEEPQRVFGIKPKGTDVSSGKLDMEGYRELSRALVKRFGFRKVAISLRESISASENIWSACLFDGKKFVKSPKHRVWIVDRVGTGDAFAAGLIFSLLKGKTDREALHFGVAAACLKHSICGDFNLVSVEEVERVAAGETAGRVQR
ncbi:MAG: KHG/KDPG aldolase/sugar kinase fusion protein [Candidatus Aminicenantes bacterium]|jgi:2-dehydro-3-deoxygluconokinase